MTYTSIQCACFSPRKQGRKRDPFPSLVHLSLIKTSSMSIPGSNSSFAVPLQYSTVLYFLTEKHALEVYCFLRCVPSFERPQRPGHFPREVPGLWESEHSQRSLSVNAHFKADTNSSPQLIVFVTYRFRSLHTIVFSLRNNIWDVKKSHCKLLSNFSFLFVKIFYKQISFVR